MWPERGTVAIMGIAIDPPPDSIVTPQLCAPSFPHSAGQEEREMWSDAHNGVRPLAQVCDEGSLTHEAVLHLSQAERWSSQASHLSPASHRTSPHYVAHNREERLGRARQACRSLDLDLGLSTGLGDVAHREEHQHTGESGTRAPRAGTGDEVCAGGGADVPYAADILMAREDGDLMARERMVM